MKNNVAIQWALYASAFLLAVLSCMMSKYWLLGVLPFVLFLPVCLILVLVALAVRLCKFPDVK